MDSVDQKIHIDRLIEKLVNACKADEKAWVEMLNSDAPKTTELRFDVPSIGENWTVRISYKVEDVKIQRDKTKLSSVTFH